MKKKISVIAYIVTVSLILGACSLNANVAGTSSSDTQQLSGEAQTDGQEAQEMPTHKNPPLPAPEPKPEPKVVTLGDYETTSDRTGINISGMDVSGLDVDTFINEIPDLKLLIMKDCGLENEEYAALQDAHPDVRIIWNIKTRWWTIPTDAVAFSTLIAIGQEYKFLTDDEAYYFRYCKDMVALDIGHCRVTDLSFLEYMPNLKVLIVVENHRSDGGRGRITDFSPIGYCTKLRYLECFANDAEDFSFLSNLPEIEDLNICYNRISDVSYLENLPNLQKLWIEGTRLKYDDYVKLTEEYPNAKIVYYGSGSVDQGWREGPHYEAMRNMVKNNVIDDVYR